MSGFDKGTGILADRVNGIEDWLAAESVLRPAQLLQ